jgi:anti-sigma regulatory factor (Ser/Thr protein kinase)
MISHGFISVADASSIGEARRAVSRLAELAHLEESDASRASIIVTELATNLSRHARPGTGAIAIVANTSVPEIHITSLDTGPGMTDILRCLRDGYSTGGTAGNGMGAVKRLSDEMDLFSLDSGTVIWARVMRQRYLRSRAR